MSSDINILIAEDDADINQLLSNILLREGYSIRSAYSGTEAKMCLEQYDYDLLLLDLMLPGISGEALIEDVRRIKVLPIIVISAKTTIEDKINVLKLGADDFICKPFNIQEVIARVEAQLRRYTKFSVAKEQGHKLSYKDLVLDSNAKEVYLKNKQLSLTMIEFKILELLMSNPKRVFTRANIFEKVWNDEFLGDDNTVNVHISNLRNKLAQVDKDTKYIQTVWGIGFKLQE